MGRVQISEDGSESVSDLKKLIAVRKCAFTLIEGYASAFALNSGRN